MDCPLVIRGHNEEAHMSPLLARIQHQTMRDVEIILVGSGLTFAPKGIVGQRIRAGGPQCSPGDHLWVFSEPWVGDSHP
jgi:hypothetical protein